MTLVQMRPTMTLLRFKVPSRHRDVAPSVVAAPA